MNRLVAVDDKLANVRQVLEEKGYEVASIDKGLARAAVVVISGMDDNLSGDETTLTRAPVVEAAGLSAQEVLEEVERALRTQQ